MWNADHVGSNFCTSAGKHGCSYVVVDPKGGTLDQCGAFLRRQGYEVRVFNSIDFSKSMHYNRATCSPLKRWRTALFQSVL